MLSPAEHLKFSKQAFDAGRKMAQALTILSMYAEATKVDAIADSLIQPPPEPLDDPFGQHE